MKALDQRIFILMFGLTKNKTSSYIVKNIAAQSSGFFLMTYGLSIVYLIMTRDLILLPFIIGPGLSLLSVIVIRHFVKRKRPFELFDIEPLIVHEKGSSFPSKHGTSAFAIAFAMIWVHPLIAGIGIILALLTGISRIMVGVHYPSDILGGLFIAIVMSQLTYFLSMMLMFN